MPDITPAPRRRPLWRLFIMPVLLLVAAAAWSAFWFFAASQVEVRSDAWRAREAESGRVYDCARRSVAGFPFRLEVRCSGASVSLRAQTVEQAATRTPVTASLGEILVVAQIWDPKRLIAEFTAPATISDRGGPPAMMVNWSKARSSVVGLPDIPQRGSIVFDDPSIDRVNGPVATVWYPYDLYVDGQWSHCGVDVFTLIRTDGQWRIATMSWSAVQPPACEKHPDGPPKQ